MLRVQKAKTHELPQSNQTIVGEVEAAVSAFPRHMETLSGGLMTLRSGCRAAPAPTAAVVDCELRRIVIDTTKSLFKLLPGGGVQTRRGGTVLAKRRIPRCAMRSAARAGRHRPACRQVAERGSDGGEVWVDGIGNPRRPEASPPGAFRL